MTPSAYNRVFMYFAHLYSSAVSKEFTYISVYSPNHKRWRLVHMYALCTISRTKMSIEKKPGI